MNRILHTLAGICVGLVFGSAVAALAARNSSGTYTLPTGNPVVTGTAVSSTWANNTLNDIKTEITDSLSRSGKGGMTAPLRGADGSSSAPALSFTSEPGSGLYRNTTSDVRMSINGTSIQQWNSSTSTITGGLAVTGNETVGGSMSSATLAVSGTSSFTGVATYTAAPVFNGGFSASTGSFTTLAVSGPTTSAPLTVLTSSSGSPVKGVLNIAPNASEPSAPSNGDMWIGSRTLGWQANGTLYHPVKGIITLTGGTASINFGVTGLQCVCMDVTVGGSVVSCTTAGTSISFGGTGTDSVAYVCL